ncbi:MAG: CRTAC1 family protein [Phycisphaerales bacterium]|nr:CRTAC1 family protein [Phycisphaerales bacterium]
MSQEWLSVLALVGSLAAVSNASSPLSFSEEAVSRGIFHSTSSSTQFQFGAGTALVDLDGDDDLDILLTGSNGGVMRIYENDGAGYFTNRNLGSNLGLINSSGVATADYDNDGDQDIFISGWLSSSKLYRNDGNFVFTDVTLTAGMDVVSAAMAPTWGDYNQDGNMDLYVPTRSGASSNWVANRLYHNNGDGTFTDVAVTLDVDAENDPTLLAAFFDYDRDGDDDLYLGTDKGTSFNWWNRLYRNDGGTFTEITGDANAYAYIDCMGIALADLNNDSLFDVYMTDTSRNVLFLNDGTGVFEDHSDAAGVTSGVVGWGTVFADFDNDSFPDLFVCNQNAPNALFRGSEIANWPMANEASAAGVDLVGSSYTVAVGDVNNDGLLDILVDHINSNVKLYINQSPDASSNHMIRLKPVGELANELCVGATFNIEANGKWQAVEARAGVNYKVSEGRTVQVGVGTDTEVETIEVIWPNGGTRTLTTAPVDRTWTIYEESRLGDVNNDGMIDPSELQAAKAAMTGPGVKIEPGVEIFDMDGDFDIDNDDIAILNPCKADLNHDGTLDFFDISYFLSNMVDFNLDEVFDFFDISAFLQAYGAGCP